MFNYNWNYDGSDSLTDSANYRVFTKKKIIQPPISQTSQRSFFVNTLYSIRIMS